MMQGVCGVKKEFNWFKSTALEQQWEQERRRSVLEWDHEGLQEECSSGNESWNVTFKHWVDFSEFGVTDWQSIREEHKDLGFKF